MSAGVIIFGGMFIVLSVAWLCVEIWNYPSKEEPRGQGQDSETEEG